MPKVSKESAAQVEDHGPVEDRHEDIDGYTVNFLTFRVDIDGAPLLKGLPDDRCNCPHWGYVLKGKVRILYKDHEEVLQTGDIYYMAPGHIPVTEEECHFIEFSAPEDYENKLTSLK